MARHHAGVLIAALAGGALLLAADAPAQTIDRYARTAAVAADGAVRMTIDLRTAGDGTPLPTRRDAAGEGTLAAASAPHGSQRVTFRYVNLTGAGIPRLDVSIRLPAGFEVAAIDAVDPPVTDATVMLPYVLTQEDGHPVIGIAQRTMAPGAAIGLTFRARAASSPWPLSIVLMALVVRYLLLFRDLPAESPHLHASAPAR